MKAEIKQKLLDLFGDRVAFHHVERLLYSSDLAALPAMITSRIETMPDAVVMPRSREELVALIGLATTCKIPLVPRGAGTAGYGGAVPARGGIVVDFSRMNAILNVDREKKRVTVEPGVIWQKLEQTLNKTGLALRLYPGSSVSATVGGWIANGGGIGIGGFEYGYLKENIVELELISPAGITKIDKESLGFVEGMAGATGFISRVTLLVRKHEKDVPIVAAFPTIEGLLWVMDKVRERKLPLWEVGYKDKMAVELTDRAMEQQAHKGPVSHPENALSLPHDNYIATFVFPESREKKVKAELLSIIKAAGGEALSQELADFEWSERFYGMRLKALGPSIIPSEVIVPTARLAEFVMEVSNKVKGLAFNGTFVAGGKEAAFLGYRLDDERRRGFAFAFVNSLIPLKAANKLGGRPYTTGMFVLNAVSCVGKEQLEKAYRFKKQMDPEGIMNPGKVFPGFLDKNSPVRLMNVMAKVAAGQILTIKTVDALFGGKAENASIGSGNPLGTMPFGNELAWDAFSCANCGYCRADCAEFRAIGWESASPRGKFHFLREYLKGNVKFDERMAEMFFACTTCGHCNHVCQVRASIDEHWSLTMRPLLWRAGFNPPSVHQGNAHNIHVHHNPPGISQSERTAWMTPDLKYRKEGEIGYFAGCGASFSGSTRNLAVNAVRILNKAGIEPVYLGSDEWCCGGTMFMVGCIDDLLQTVVHNVDEMNKRGIKTLYTSCSGCWLHLAHFYPVLARRANKPFPIQVKHLTQCISEMIEAGKLVCKFPVNLKVTYHDPCHIGRGGGIYEEPRKILAAIPELELIEMERIKEEGRCCGRHVMRYPRLGMAIHNERLDEVKATGVPVLIGACPTCETNFRLGVTETGSKLEVFDITDLVCQSVGLPTLVMSRLMKLGVM
jgi:Fe-S oxidoreductase/FAD/FMN-containing dehydrogenase